MTPDEILSFPAKVLTQAQREHYFEHGFVGVDGVVDETVLSNLQRITGEFVERSRSITVSDQQFDIHPDHRADDPKLRRLKSPDASHPGYWDFAKGLMADVAADLVGPNVVFHHSKLNFKWFDESDTVKWHQDIQFFPHTNYNVITIGCYLADTDMTNGPLAVLDKSHDDDLFNQYDAHGNWVGMLSDEDAASLDTGRIRFLTGLAGSITVHNARTLHYSPSSKSPRPRPLLLNCYTSADAKPYTAHPDPTVNAYRLLRGEQVQWIHHDPRPCQVPPDWSAGYGSIYSAQSGATQTLTAN